MDNAARVQAPKKPEVPSIPQSPAKQSKPLSRSRVRKTATEAQPEPAAPGFAGLWEAFDASWGLGEPPETRQPTPDKTRSRKGAGKH
jgi:hypothetical protein